MKLSIKTYYKLGKFPYHAILDENGCIVCELMDRNYKLACKLREAIIANKKLLNNDTKKSH